MHYNSEQRHCLTFDAVNINKCGVRTLFGGNNCSWSRSTRYKTYSMLFVLLNAHRIFLLKNWDTYESLLAFAEQIRLNTKHLYPRDYIDLQSFIWVMGSDEYPD